MQCKRFGSKINIQRPKPPHYSRKLFNAVTEPIYNRKTAIDFCQERQALQKLERDHGEKLQLHPYESILAKELFGFFDSSKMILICHMNSMTAFESFNFKVALHKKNIKTKIYGRKIIEAAIADTKFHAMLSILKCTSHNCMLFGDEWNVKDVLAVLKKTPKVILLAGSLGDRFMSKNQLDNYANLPDLTTTQAQFVATLNSVGGQLTNHLQAHQSNFAYMLDAYADSLKKLSDTSTTKVDTAETTDESTT